MNKLTNYYTIVDVCCFRTYSVLYFSSSFFSIFKPNNIILPMWRLRIIVTHIEPGRMAIWFCVGLYKTLQQQTFPEEGNVVESFFQMVLLLILYQPYVQYMAAMYCRRVDNHLLFSCILITILFKTMLQRFTLLGIYLWQLYILRLAPSIDSQKRTENKIIYFFGFVCR